MKGLLLRFAIAFLTFTIGTLFIALLGPRIGTADTVWTSPNGTFKVRLVADLETGDYRFLFTTEGRDSWKEFMALQLGYSSTIPYKRVVFVDEQIVYVSIERLFAVTTDGGKNWNLWDSHKDFPKGYTYNQGIIEWLEIKADGTGQMLIWENGIFKNGNWRLATKDYGKNWDFKGWQPGL